MPQFRQDIGERSQLIEDKLKIYNPIATHPPSAARRGGILPAAGCERQH
jgi:hypothetical protein